MEGSLLRKNVVFLGMWKTSRLDDSLEREIARKAPKIRGQGAQLEIRTVGARLYTRTGTQNSVIRMPNVQDIVLNRYDPGFVLCVLREGRYLNVLVCRCIHVRDSSDVLKSFRASKRDDRSILSESKQSVTLRQNLYRAGRQPEKNRNIIQTFQGPGSLEVCHVGVQVTPGENDNISLSPSIKSIDLREELSNLSEEVKAIKILLEKSAGVQSEQRTQSKTIQSHTVAKSVKKTLKPQILEPPTITRGEFVSAKSPLCLSELVEDTGADGAGDVFDGRRSSVGAVDSGVRSFSVPNSSVFCENDNTDYRDNDTDYRNSDTDHRYSDSTINQNMSIPDEEDFLRHKNPSSFGNTRLTTYITAPPGFQTQTLPSRDRSYTAPGPRDRSNTAPGPGKRYKRQSQVVLSTTVPRTIENVYPNNIRSTKTAKRRSRQEISPETFVAGARERRQRSSSAHDSYRGRLNSEDMELRRSLYKLYNEA